MSLKCRNIFSFFICLLISFHYVSSAQVVKATVKKVPSYYRKKEPDVEAIEKKDINKTQLSHTERVLKVLANGYFDRDSITVEYDANLYISGRLYWYGIHHKQNPVENKKLCTYPIQETYYFWRVFYPTGLPVTDVVFECDESSEDCCELDCCTNVLSDCYIVLAFFGTFLVVVLVLGIYIKFRDEITLLIFHFKIQKFKRQRVKELLKNDDANYIPVNE